MALFLGTKTFPAGRVGEAPSYGLSRSLKDAGFQLGRLKTGTPPRIDGKSIDYSKTTPQYGDEPPSPFSYMNLKVSIEVSCVKNDDSPL